MSRTVEDLFLDKILYIGNGLPPAIMTDGRPKFVLLGTPAELIEAIKNLDKEEE